MTELLLMITLRDVIRFSNDCVYTRLCHNSILLSMINEYDQTSMKSMINVSMKINLDRTMNMMKMQMNI